MSHRKEKAAPPSPERFRSRRANPSRSARFWPLPDRERILPSAGGPGSFWEDRGDRHHAGVDLYAPSGSRVVSIEDGEVISVGIFTGPELVPYWNRTYQVTIAHASGIFCRYAELGDAAVREGSRVAGGDLVGHVGEVLNLARIGADAPPYIRNLKERGRASMLHLEVYGSEPTPDPGYRGGNWFTRAKPAGVMDPVRILRDIP